MSEQVKAVPKYNFKHIQHSFYLVRTQSGLKQAIKHYIKTRGVEYVEEMAANRMSYPAIISIAVEDVAGRDFIRVHNVHVNKMAEAIRGE